MNAHALKDLPDIITLQRMVVELELCGCWGLAGLFRRLLAERVRGLK